MAAPLTGSWAGINATTANMDGTTHGSGTSDPNPFPTGRPFYRTDTKQWKVTTDGGTTWVVVTGPVAEASSTPITSGTNSAGFNNRRSYGNRVTLPTTEDFYIISGLEWWNNSTVNGNIICGVDLVDADPPVSANTMMASYSSSVAQSGASQSQRNSSITNLMVLPGGAKVMAWINCSSATATLDCVSIGSQNIYKVETYTANPSVVNTTAWTATTLMIKLKIYYVGYKA